MKLLNPRGYLSWTQVSLFEQSPQKYKEKYILGNLDTFTNDFMKVGSQFASALEDNETTGDETMDLVISQIVKYAKSEYKLVAPFKTKFGEIVLLGKLDTFEDSPTLKFREYKTGSVKWTQSKAEKHGQLLHYASLIWLTYKRLPNEIWLDWIPTKRESDGVVRLTGEPIVPFKVNIGLTQVLEYMARVTKVAVAIDQMMRQELNIK
jgi:hypothetical protein